MKKEMGFMGRYCFCLFFSFGNPCPPHLPTSIKVVKLSWIAAS